MDNLNGLSVSADLRKCFAHIACFLKNPKTDKRYAVVNRHVALHSRTDIFIERTDGTKLSLGKPLNVSNDNSKDFGLVEVNGDFSCEIRNKVVNYNEQLTDAVVFDGHISDLYNRTVLKTKPFANGNASSSSSKLGKVMSSDYHESLFKKIDLVTQFCVQGDDMFAQRGDCGTAVALVKGVKFPDSCGILSSNGNPVEIVGMVCGGDELSGIAYCLFLPFVISELEKQYGMSLSVCLDIHLQRKRANAIDNTDMNASSKDVVSLAKDMDIIGCSTTIYFSIQSTPEQIAPYAFDLAERASAFMCYKFNAFQPESHAQILSHEQLLKKQVNLRKLEAYLIFENTNADYEVVERGLQAIDCLIRGQLKDGERNLKVALACILKCEGVALRLFAKSVSYIIWFYNMCKTKSARKTVSELLKLGEAFCSENADRDGFPREVCGYLQYELSRHHIQEYDLILRQPCSTTQPNAAENTHRLAVQRARNAVENVKEVHSLEGDDLSLVRLCLMKTELAFALLGFGNEFNVTGTCIDVEQNAINEADMLLIFVTKNVVNTGILHGHALKFNLYLIAMCDLKLRQGHVKLALELAQKCLDLSKIKGDVHNECRSRRRKDVLLEMMRNKKMHEPYRNFLHCGP